MPPLSLTAALVDAIFAEARARYPSECCGVVVGPAANPAGQRFVPFENLQDQLHARDPATWPRDARIAYAMDPLKLQRLVDQTEASGEALVAIVHSHPDHPSYFSQTDERAASPFGLPSFPDVAQVVVSVFEGEICDLKAFHWDGESWPERPVRGLPPLPGPPPGARILGEV